MEKMLKSPTGRGLLARPRLRIILLIVLVIFSSYYFLCSGPVPHFSIVPYLAETPGSSSGSTSSPKSSKHEHEHEHDEDDGSLKDGKPANADVIINQDIANPSGHTGQEGISTTKTDNIVGEKEREMLESWKVDINDLRKWSDPDDHEDPNDVEPGYETDGKVREAGSISRLQHEKDLRKMWRYAYKTTANLEISNLIYGNTLNTLDFKDNRTDTMGEKLREDPRVSIDFSIDKPVRFNPYPDYNNNGWKEQRHAPYVPCKGPTGELVEDLLVFKGRPHNWPEPKFGSYDVLNMDPNICWERNTRLGPFGLLEQRKKVGGESQLIDWKNINWGDLQRRCVELNAKRYEMNRVSKNEYLDAYHETSKPVSSTTKSAEKMKIPQGISPETPKIRGRSPTILGSDKKVVASSQFTKETRTAILLRSYTGKKYTENDKQVIRALISELTLKSGGEYEVFLLVHVKDQELRPFDDEGVYQKILYEYIPVEFHGITVLWNDKLVWDIYTELKDENERSVHTAQWLSVQKFSHDHPQFDFIWNWEMDFRYTGHHYDLLDNLAKFAAKQPRKGLWERNERWYIPEHHGDYDTTFRQEVEERSGNETVWGAPDLPFIHPVGPKPPVATPEQDNYKWGVGEEADFITVSPMFNPVNSIWIIGNHIWGYNDANHKSVDLPRRTTIVTQSRISKRLLDIMHVENLRGNHVASEMTPQTVALLHGLKAVYAPHPIFMDRDWNGKFLDQWFNPGAKGETGGMGSPMGWGRERRYQGNTWYYRAEPPNRLYNNWMGWADTGIGGPQWEQQNGRPCLPSVMLHPVKDTEPTQNDHATGFELAYG